MEKINIILQEDFERIYKAVPKLAQLAGSSWLITGHRGFIGAYFTSLLCYLNDTIWHNESRFFGIDSGIAAGQNFSDRKDVMNFGWDISVDPPLSRLPTIDYVLHMASIAAPEFYKKYPLKTIHCNVNGTENILRWATERDNPPSAIAPESILHFSSSEVYGEPLQIPTPEDCPSRLNPVGERAEYDQSKAMSETLCKIYHQQYGVPVKILRPHNIYGPCQRLDDGRIIPQLMLAMQGKKPLTIYGSGTSTRSYCYISDAATQMLYVLFNGVNARVYNIGDSHSEINLVSLSMIANRVLGHNKSMAMEVRFAPTHEMLKNAPTRRAPDTTRIDSISPTPCVDLFHGLARTLAYYSG